MHDLHTPDAHLSFIAKNTLAPLRFEGSSFVLTSRERDKNMYGFKVRTLSNRVEYKRSFHHPNRESWISAHAHDTRGTGAYEGQLRLYDLKRQINIRMVDNDEAEKLCRWLWRLDDELEQLRQSRSVYKTVFLCFGFATFILLCLLAAT